MAVQIKHLVPLVILNGIFLVSPAPTNESTSAATSAATNASTSEQVHVKDFYLLVSFDGFRWDYLDMVKDRGRDTPNFDFLIKTGVKAEYINSAFVTDTWPNHWTIATGMHVESHGVVANTFYDPVLNASYDSFRTPQSYWYNNGTEGGGGEPIWVTYQKASPSDHAAVAVWPGSTTELNGVIADYQLPQENDIPFTKRIEAIVKWFTQEDVSIHGVLKTL